MIIIGVIKLLLKLKEAMLPSKIYYRSMNLKYEVNYPIEYIEIGGISIQNLQKFFCSLGFDVHYNDIETLLKNLNINIEDDYVNLKEFTRVFMNNFSTDI